MVTIEMIKKSWKSRPRKAVVFWAFVDLLIAAGGLGFWLVMKFVPSFLANLNDTVFNLMGTDWTLREFMVTFILPWGMMATCLPAWIFAQVVSKYRAAYLWFAIPSSFIVIIYVLCGIFMLITPVHAFLPASILNILLKVCGYGFTYGAMGYAGFMIFCCFLGLFYNVCPPLKYSRIYALRRLRIKHAKDGADRRYVKREFYRLYKKNKAEELLGLLVEPYLPRDSQLELIPEATYYMKIHGGNASGEIKAYEIENGLKQTEAEARNIYNQTLEDLESARNGDLSFLARGGGEPKIIIKEVPVPVKGGKPNDKLPKPQGAEKPAKPKKLKKKKHKPISDDPLWSPDQI